MMDIGRYGCGLIIRERFTFMRSVDSKELIHVCLR